MVIVNWRDINNTDAHREFSMGEKLGLLSEREFTWNGKHLLNNGSYYGRDN